MPHVVLPASLSHSKSGEIKTGSGKVIDQSVFNVLASNGGYKGAHSIYEDHVPEQEE